MKKMNLLKSLVLPLCLGLLAFGINAFAAISLGFGVHIIFGSVVLLIASRYVSAIACLVIGAVGAAGTVVIWGHFWAMPSLIGEAVLVYYFINKQKYDINLSTFILSYWYLPAPIIGFLFYNINLDVSHEQSAAIVLKQSSNGFINIFLANFLVLAAGAFRKRVANLNITLTVSESLISILGVSILVPSVAVVSIWINLSYSESLDGYKLEANKASSIVAKAIDREMTSPRIVDLGPIYNYSSQDEETSLNSLDGKYSQIVQFNDKADILIQVGFESGSEDSQDLVEFYFRNSHIDQGKTNPGVFLFQEKIITVISDESPNQFFLLVWNENYVHDHLKSLEQVFNVLLRSDAIKFDLIINDQEFVTREIYETIAQNLGNSAVIDGWTGARIVEVTNSAYSDFVSLCASIPLKGLTDRYYNILKNLFFVIYFSTLLISLIGHVLINGFLGRLRTPLVAIVDSGRFFNNVYLDLEKSFLYEFREAGYLLQKFTKINNTRTEQQNRIANDLTQLIDTANAPIFGIDAQGRVNEWNQTAERITGFTKDQVMGKDLVAEYITDDYKEAVKEVLDKALEGEQTANYEFPLFTSTGNRVDVLLNSTTRRDASGAIVGVVGVGQDITELKKSQEQVIHASKLATLGEMATGVAHELNQPLNVIRLAAANISLRSSAGKLNTDYLNEKVERIGEQTERAANIIDHMRMFGRKTTEKPEMVEIHMVLHSALDMISEQLKLSGIKIVKNFERSPEMLVKVHPILLEQVVLNLITNARDALSDNKAEYPSICLESYELDDHVCFRIIDNGGGIPVEIIDRVFEPFFTTKEIGKGTGLGLSVSYGIIRDFGGTMMATNTIDGAAFEVRLPMIKGTLDASIIC